MKIKYKQSMGLPRGESIVPGDVAEVDDEKAERLIAKGIAVAYDGEDEPEGDEGAVAVVTELRERLDISDDISDEEIADEVERLIADATATPVPGETETADNPPAPPESPEAPKPETPAPEVPKPPAEQKGKTAATKAAKPAGKATAAKKK